MSVVLGIDTSAELCTAAVSVDGVIVAHDSQRMQRRHNEQILATIDQVLDVGLRSRLDAVAFGCGPGSFTGIRLAASVTQGIALATGAQVVPVSSTRALAHAARDAGIAGTLVTVIPSRRDACYVAGFAERAGQLEQVLSDQLWEGKDAWVQLGEALGEFASDVRLVGRVPAELDQPDSTLVEVDGAVIARLGGGDLADGGGRPVGEALPVYLHGDHPWRPTGA